MTRLGGAANNGVIYRYDLATGGYSVLHTFAGGPFDGARPDHGGLTFVGRRLYGLTTLGGRNNTGVLFRMDTSGANFQVLHTFAPGARNGSTPEGSLEIQGSMLYSTTSGGGPAGQGVVFQIRTSGAGFRVLHAFRGPTADGAVPLDGVVVSRGRLFGMTEFGGSVLTPRKRTGNPPFANGVIYSLRV
jgi:uncharacterized repeat protein (TIGR03803 family)